jgi:site-specific DNA recombinase
MTRDETARLVRSVGDLTAVVHQADSEDEAEIYRRLGLQLTYASGQQTVRVEIAPRPARTAQRQKPTVSERPWGNGWCPRGDLNPHAR